MTNVNEGQTEETSLSAPTDVTSANEPSTVPNQTDVVDLDGLDRFKFRGKEMTPEDLDQERLMRQDYNRKTAELGKQRQALEQKERYARALKFDLPLLRSNPELYAEEFKQKYPEEFHFLADMFASNEEVMEKAEASGEFSAKELQALEKKLEKKFEAKLAKLDRLEKDVTAREEMAADKHVDSIFTKFSEKYPYAVPDAVINRVMAALEKNKDNPEFRVTEGMWEKLFKASSDEHFKRFESQYKKQIAAQVKKGKEAGDSAPGGSAPGRGPKNETWDEATERAIQDLTARGGIRF